MWRRSLRRGLSPRGSSTSRAGVYRPGFLEERIEERLDIDRVPDEPPLEGREPEGPIAGMGLEEEVLDGDEAGFYLHLYVWGRQQLDRRARLAGFYRDRRCSCCVLSAYAGSA
jgi:hypothetical protein